MIKLILNKSKNETFENIPNKTFFYDSVLKAVFYKKQGIECYTIKNETIIYRFINRKVYVLSDEQAISCKKTLINKMKRKNEILDKKTACFSKYILL